LKVDNSSWTGTFSKTTLGVFVILNVAVIVGVIPVHAAGLQLTQTFLNPRPASDSFFGFSVAGSHKTIIVGTPSDNTAGSHAGAAYLFNASNGELLRTFLSPTPNSGDEFGISVAAVGSNILIGAHLVNAGAQFSGAAYLFNGVTGKLVRTFVSPTPTFVGRFGESVGFTENNETISNDVLIGGFTAAYLFDGATGNLLQTFHDPNPSGNDAFGSRVLGVGGNVLVGAHLTSIGATASGAAYLFDSRTGALLQTFLNPNPTNFGFFGLGLGSFRGNVIIGAPQDFNGGTQSGTVFEFNSTSGALVHTIADPQPTGNDRFGDSLATVGDEILIGAPQHSITGTVFVFNGANLGLVQSISDPNPSPPPFGSAFGQSISQFGRAIIVGAPRATVSGFSAGKVYLFA